MFYYAFQVTLIKLQLRFDLVTITQKNSQLTE